MIQLQARKIKDDAISDNRIIYKVVMDAPKMYMSSIRVLQKTNGLSLNINDIKEEMCELYRMCTINNDEGDDSDDDSEKETELTTPGAFGQESGGKCYICHQSRQKFHEFPSKKKNNEGGGYKGGRSGEGFKGTCNGCGKYGHKKNKFWEYDRNKSKRPDGYKNARERNLETTEGAGDKNEGKGKFMLMNFNVGIFQTPLSYLATPIS